MEPTIAPAAEFTTAHAMESTSVLVVELVAAALATELVAMPVVELTVVLAVETASQLAIQPIIECTVMYAFGTSPKPIAIHVWTVDHNGATPPQFYIK